MTEEISEWIYLSTCGSAFAVADFGNFNVLIIRMSSSISSFSLVASATLVGYLINIMPFI
jgi:hypothetical protein